MLTIMIYRRKIIVKAHECHGVSNHHWFDILFFRLCRVTEKRTQRSGCLPSDRSIPLRNAEYFGKRLISWYHHAYRTWTGLAHHDDVIKWKHFPRYWPFVRGIHRSPQKGQWRGALMFSFICVWVDGWVNNRGAGDLRRYRAHYDVIVMRNDNFYWLQNRTCHRHGVYISSVLFNQILHAHAQVGYCFDIARDLIPTHVT